MLDVSNKACTSMLRSFNTGLFCRQGLSCRTLSCLPLNSHRNTKYLLGILIFVVVYVCGVSLVLGRSEKNWGPAKFRPNQSLYQHILDVNASRLNLTSPFVDTRSSIIAIVLCKPNDRLLRDGIRNTWSHRNYSEAVRNGSISVFFLVGSNIEDTNNVLLESQEHKDILMVDVVDSYRGLVYKVLAAFRWINVYHPNKTVLKIDSDVILRLDKMCAVAQQQFFTDPVIVCRVVHSAPVLRDPENQWHISSSLYAPSSLPDYCSGPLYMMSSTALKRILETARTASVIEVEDAFFTGILAQKAGVTTVGNDVNILAHKPSAQLCSDGKPALIGYPFHTDEYTIRQAFKEFNELACKNSLQSIWNFMFPDY